MGIFGPRDAMRHADFIDECFSQRSTTEYFADDRFARFMAGPHEKPQARAVHEFEQITGYPLAMCD